MIKNITKLKNFWIFNDFTWLETDFNKYNLIYWWNWSWKTTLSKAFYWIYDIDNSFEDFQNREFSISLVDWTEINNSNYKTNIININVFNEDFVKNNIDWNETIKKILLISKESIDKSQELEKLNTDYKTKDDEINKKWQNLYKNEEDIDKNLSSKAKQIKEQFYWKISVNDTRYRNYDKSKLKDFLNTKKDIVKSLDNKLNTEELKILLWSLKLNDKENIGFNISNIDISKLLEIDIKINDLLKQDFTDGIIEDLKKNIDIWNWVEKWLEIHEKHWTEKCLFCLNTLNQERLNEIKLHFNDWIKELKEKLNIAKNYINENIILKTLEFDKLKLYEELQQDFWATLEKINIEIWKINNVFNKWLEKINEKLENPTQKINWETLIDERLLKNYDNLKNDINSIIIKHNEKFSSYDKELKNNQQKLELHYATEFQIDKKYFSSLENNIKEKEAIENLKKERIELDKKISEIQSSISSEVLWAEDFNSKLEKFLWHNEIKLKFNSEKWWYEIIRWDNKKAKNLSEWERTAIAFIYFITKLGEKNDLSNEIVIIDDPISSFDSNNIFNIYSIIKTKLESVKQLIILTHSFTFFKLIRDWFFIKNKKEDENGNKKVKSNFYQIDIVSFNPRKSEIKKAWNSLIKYDSEYHFVFDKLNHYKNEDILDLEKSFEVANLWRKLLECFLAFKFPKKRDNFRALLEVWIESINIEDKYRLREKVYQFINKYSHLEVISFWEWTENNQLWESNNIVKDIFSIIEKLDEKHYKELLEVCS